MTLGEYIRDYRTRLGLSQREFAIKCGVSNAYISMLERGVNPSTNAPVTPSFETFIKLARAMNMPVQSLIDSVEDAIDIGGDGNNVQITPLSDGELSEEEKNYKEKFVAPRMQGDENPLPELLMLLSRAKPKTVRALLAMIKILEDYE